MQLTKISGKSPLAAAIRYALTRMERLRPYLDNGMLELDNNVAERGMRAIALGRKNYLFVGSEAGGKAAAIAYTLIETAKLNDIDPFAWLADTIARIPDYKINRVDDLLPWKWKAFAAGTGKTWSHEAVHDEAPWHIFQFFGHILADPAQMPAAIGAGVAAGRQFDFHARDMIRDRLALRLTLFLDVGQLHPRGHRRGRDRAGFQCQLQLLDGLDELPMQFLVSGVDVALM